MKNSTRVRHRPFATELILGLALCAWSCALLESCSEKGALDCESDSDCDDFGADVSCASGTCSSAGIRCAVEAGLDPAHATGENDVPTYAALLEEWLTLTEELGAAYCTAKRGCGTETGVSCTEALLDVVATTCCQATVDFHLEHRNALLACPVDVDCDSLAWNAYCPGFAETSFESLCE